MSAPTTERSGSTNLTCLSDVSSLENKHICQTHVILKQPHSLRAGLDCNHLLHLIGQLEDPEGYAARLDNKIESLTGQTESGELQCLVCGKLGQVRQNMRNHIETHVGEVVACELCGKQFKTRNSLNVHRSTKHKPPTPAVNHHPASQRAGQQYRFNPQ